MGHEQMETATLSLLLAFNIALALVAFLGGWMIRTLFARLDKLEAADSAHTESLNELRVALPTHYVQKGDLQQALSPILVTLSRIEEKLDRKADKD